MAAVAPNQPPRLAGTSLRARLAVLMVVGAILLAAVGSLSGLAITRLVDARQTLIGQVDPASLEADQLLVAYLDEETGVRGYVLSGDPTFLQPFTTGLQEQKTASSALARDLADLPGLQALADAMERQGTVWQHEFAEPAVQAVAGGSTAYSSEAALLHSKHLFDRIRSRAAALDAALAAKRASAGAQLNSATDLLIGILIAGLVLLVLAGVGMRRSLRRWVLDPLGRLGSDARVVAAGEVAHAIPPTGPPEFQRLAGDVEAMRERIVAELEQVRAARADLDERNRDLARSNVELEQFAYVASHDLQEPLRKVTSFVQLLQQRYEGQLDERADQFIGFAVDGAKRMQVLINDLLAFSRVGRTSERFVRVDLAVVVDTAMANLASAIEESGARIESGELPTVMGDPGLLGALWQNLIANSIKFRADRPPVVAIEASAPGELPGTPVTTTTTDPPGRVPGGSLWTFSITDNGIGIEPRFAEKIFVIFQRLHSRESYEGTGIGLALCKKIVEFHGGTIWLDPDHHPGTRLCFTLPVDPHPPGNPTTAGNPETKEIGS